jgi:hypothetical protein
MADPKDHRIAWADGGTVEIDRCGCVPVDFTLTAAEFNYGSDTSNQCPVCKKWLRLVWDVRIEATDAP